MDLIKTKWYQVVDNRADINYIKNIIETSDEFTYYICGFCKDLRILKHLFERKPENLFTYHITDYPIHILCWHQPAKNLEFIFNTKLFNLFVLDSLNYTPLHILCWRQDRRIVVPILLNFLKRENIDIQLEIKKEALYCGQLTTPSKILTFYNCLDILS